MEELKWTRQLKIEVDDKRTDDTPELDEIYRILKESPVLSSEEHEELQERVRHA
jgi:hypothetical protein